MFFISQRRHLITRLRQDTALYQLWTKGRVPGQREPTCRYDGKAAFNNLSRWRAEDVHPLRERIRLYWALLYRSGSPVKTLRAHTTGVLLLGSLNQKYVLLASTDQQQPAF